MILCSAGDISSAVECVRAGAADFLIKEIELGNLVERIHDLFCNAAQKDQQTTTPVPPVKKRLVPSQIVFGKSSRMLHIVKVMRRAAAFPVAVLLLGESGTGKELFARWIHHMSDRAENPFIGVNVTAVPADLLESTLFGHVKGAFTGAVGQRAGKITQAQNGTLLLDEIAELKAELQPKLLRVLQEGEYEPVGSERTMKSEARIIAATNQDIISLVEQGLFRTDLYYRLNTLTITLPPLRERREDIPELVDLFLNKYNCLYNRSINRLCSDAMDALMDHSWPGNIRELENCIQRAVALADEDAITERDLFDLESSSHEKLAQTVTNEPRTLEDLECQYIEEILHRTEGHQGQAASILGIDRKTLYNKILKYGLGRSLDRKSGRGQQYEVAQ